MNILVLQRQTNVAEKPIPSRSVFARILEPLEYLQSRNPFSITVLDESEIELDSLSKFQVIILQKHSSVRSIQIAETSKKNGLRVIYDIDDFLPAFPNYSGGQGVSKKIEALKQHTQIADVVTTATDFLKTKIDPYFGINSFLAPNGINVERHRAHLNPHKNKKIIFTNADLLKVQTFKQGLFESINRFLNARPDYSLDVISDPNPELNHFSRYHDLGNLNWFDHKKVMAQNGYSLAIVPLGGDDDPDSLIFNKCKSPIKYLEYGSLDIVGIYSDSFIYSSTIKHRETGVVVPNDQAAWLAALTELIENQDLCQRIQVNALEDIMLNHHVRLSSQAWLSILK